MKPNIFEYTDYRKYLSDYYCRSKENNPAFSHRYFARKVGVSSGSFFNLVTKGKRNLSKDFTHKFAKAMGLTKKEFQYFETLVNFNQAKTPETKHYYLGILKNLATNYESKALTEEQFEYISNWYYPAIREIVNLPNFREDPYWIKKALRGRITAKEAGDALDALLKLKLLKRNDLGRLEQSDDHLITDDEVFHAAAYSFHKQILELAAEAAGRMTEPERKITGLTMGLSKRQFAEVKKILLEAEEAIFKYVSSSDERPENVFQLNFQLFSLTGEAK